MSVIINEMEVAAQAAAEPAPAAQPEQPGAPGPSALELREIMRHVAERLQRVRAD